MILLAEEVDRMKSQEELEKEARDEAARQALAVQYAVQQYGYVYEPPPQGGATLSDTFEAERTYRLACEHTYV